MMNSIAFAKNSIDRIVSEFQNVKCRYEFHQPSFTHFIEVIPNDVYKFNEGYVELEEKIVEDFEELFPAEFICFLTDDSTYKISNPIYTKHGCEYAITELIGVQYASFEYLSRSHKSFAKFLSSCQNVATVHHSVQMFSDKPGCRVVLYHAPPVIDTFNDKAEALYEQSLFCNLAS